MKMSLPKLKEGEEYDVFVQMPDGSERSPFSYVVFGKKVLITVAARNIPYWKNDYTNGRVHDFVAWAESQDPNLNLQSLFQEWYKANRSIRK